MHQVRLTGDSKMTTGVNGCLFLCAGAVTDSSVVEKAAGKKKIFLNIILF